MNVVSACAGLAFERSARRDLTTWAILLIGAGFVFAACTIDPRTNCDDSGSCAPWLVPVAGVMGGCAVMMGLGLLLANPRRGCAIDPASGDLMWWKNRTPRSPGDTGRIHPSRIVRIRIDRSGDSERISLYGDDGERQPFFDEEVIPWPYDRWAERFRHVYPHVRIDIRN